MKTANAILIMTFITFACTTKIIEKSSSTEVRKEVLVPSGLMIPYIPEEEITFGTLTSGGEFECEPNVSCYKVYSDKMSAVLEYSSRLKCQIIITNLIHKRHNNAMHELYKLHNAEYKGELINYQVKKKDMDFCIDKVKINISYDAADIKE